MLIFASKKVFATACINFRSMWENGSKVEFEKLNTYTNYIRLSGYINGQHYQVHVNSQYLGGRCYRSFVTYSDNDAELLKIFALACACADYGQYYKKFAHLAASLVLNY